MRAAAAQESSVACGRPRPSGAVLRCCSRVYMLGSLPPCPHRKGHACMLCSVRVRQVPRVRNRSARSACVVCAVLQQVLQGVVCKQGEVLLCGPGVLLSRSSLPMREGVKGPQRMAHGARWVVRARGKAMVNVAESVRGQIDGSSAAQEMQDAWLVRRARCHAGDCHSRVHHHQGPVVCLIHSIRGRAGQVATSV